MRIVTFLLLVTANLQAQNADAGRITFESRCARCHGADGGGAEMGPPIARRLAGLADPQLASLIREGLPARGMPPNPMPDPEMTPLTRFLRSLQARAAGRPVVRRQVLTTAGRTLDGIVLNEGFEDLQLRTEDLHVHLLRKAGDRYREVTSETGWPGYNGQH